MYQIDQILLKTRLIRLTEALHVSELVHVDVLVLIATPSNWTNCDEREVENERLELELISLVVTSRWLIVGDRHQ